MFYNTDSLRQEALVSDKSLIVQPANKNGGASREIEQNWVCTLANLRAIAGSKSTSIALKLGLRLMKGEQSKDCQKSA